MKGTGGPAAEGRRQSPRILRDVEIEVVAVLLVLDVDLRIVAKDLTKLIEAGNDFRSSAAGSGDVVQRDFKAA